jgi:hypothetical protein
MMNSRCFKLFVLEPHGRCGNQDTGGLRKVRWATKGRGKSGGVRVIYFYVTAAAQIRLIAIYKKGVKDDLNAAEKKVLKKLNENW